MKIPETDPIEELARFWDAHDVTDFKDQLKEVTEPVFSTKWRLFSCLYFPKKSKPLSGKVNPIVKTTKRLQNKRNSCYAIGQKYPQNAPLQESGMIGSDADVLEYGT